MQNGVTAATKWVGLIISLLTLVSISGGVLAGVFYGGQWFERTRSEIEATRRSVDQVTDAVRSGFEQAGMERKRIEQKVEDEVDSLRKDIVPRGEWEKQMRELVQREEWERQWRQHEKRPHASGGEQ